jgi:catechol 2,3-dioxygenase-like lactoylglutathione lyase family enzyme
VRFTKGAAEAWISYLSCAIHLQLRLSVSWTRRREHEHLDAAAGVDGIEAFYAQCEANGARIIKPLTATAWGTKDFYVEDPDGYIVCFGGRPAGE